MVWLHHRWNAIKRRSKVLKKNNKPPGILPNVIQLSNHMGDVGPHHLESYLLLPHDLKPVTKHALPLATIKQSSEST